MPEKTITELSASLARLIKELRAKDSFFKHKFTYQQIHEATGLPQGSLHYYIKNEKLPSYRYQILCDYTQKVLKDYEVWRVDSNPLN